MNDVLRLICKTIICPLVLTIAIEGAVVFLLTLKSKYLTASFVCNMLTNPFLNGVLLLIGNEKAYYIVLALLEICVVIAEAIIYKSIVPGCTKKKGFIISLASNLCSFLLGLLIL